MKKVGVVNRKLCKFYWRIVQSAIHALRSADGQFVPYTSRYFTTVSARKLNTRQEIHDPDNLDPTPIKLGQGQRTICSSYSPARR